MNFKLWMIKEAIDEEQRKLSFFAAEIGRLRKEVQSSRVTLTALDKFMKNGIAWRGPCVNGTYSLTVRAEEYEEFLRAWDNHTARVVGFME